MGVKITWTEGRIATACGMLKSFFVELNSAVDFWLDALDDSTKVTMGSVG